jgi:iron complex transport system substrate-binding protein
MFTVVLALGSVFPGGKKQADRSAAGNAETITVTDLAGRDVVIRIPVKKVSINWSGSGGAFMTMSALLGKDVADYIASWDPSLKNYRFDKWEQYRADIPKLNDIPIIGAIERGEFSLETLINLKPDLVIWSLNVKKHAEEVVEPALKQAGIPIVYIDYLAETVENHSRSTRLLGKIFGKEERAEELVKFYVDNMNLITSRIAGQRRPLVYIETGMEGPAIYGGTYSHNYSWGGMVAAAGGTSLGEGRVANLGPLEPEVVISGNPERIILTGSYWADKPESIRMGYIANEADTQRLIGNYLKRPGWASLEAVKNKKVFAIYHGLGFHMEDVAAIAFLAKCFHPELFADIDPLGMLQEYHNRFLPFGLNGVWMTQVR